MEMDTGTKVLIETDGLDSLHQELTERKNSYMKSGMEDLDCGRILTAIDSFGDKLVFVAKAISKEQEL